MDGVLADFAGHYEAVFGWRPDQEDNVDWAAVREVEDFYLNIPPMADLQLLWDRIERYQPIVLTGAPKEIAEAPANKRAWVSKYLGSKVQSAAVRERKMEACTARRHPDRRLDQAPQMLGQSWWNLGNAPQRRGDGCDTRHYGGVMSTATHNG